MKIIDRFTLFMVTIVLIGALVALFSIDEHKNKTYKTVIPEKILVLADNYVIDSNYVYLTKQDSIIFKSFKNEQTLDYLLTVFPFHGIQPAR